MIGQMTFGKRQFESVDSIVRSLIPPLHSAMVKAIPMIDADTDAFNDYMVIMFLTPTSAEHRCVNSIVSIV